jgi:hypothetical protein
MTTSTTIIKITADFLKAQEKIGAAIKNSTNPYFKSKYADLTAVIDACKKELNKNNIVIMQPINGMNVETILIHTSGEWFMSSTPIICKQANDPQALGSAISYARRYGLQSMVLIPADDDDGNIANNVKDPTDEWKNINDVPDKKVSATDAHFCTIHNKPMKERLNKTGGKWFDHRWQNDAGTWMKCDGKETK